MLTADELAMMVVPGWKEGPDELVGLPDFLSKLTDFLVSVPKLPFENVSPFITSLFYYMNPSFSPLSLSMCLSCNPKNLILNFQELIVTTMTGLCYSVDAKGKDFRVVHLWKKHEEVEEVKKNRKKEVIDMYWVDKYTEGKQLFYPIPVCNVIIDEAYTAHRENTAFMQILFQKKSPQSINKCTLLRADLWFFSGTFWTNGIDCLKGG